MLGPVPGHIDPNRSSIRCIRREKTWLLLTIRKRSIGNIHRKLRPRSRHQAAPRDKIPPLRPAVESELDRVMKAVEQALDEEFAVDASAFLRLALKRRAEHYLDHFCDLAYLKSAENSAARCWSSGPVDTAQHGHRLQDVMRLWPIPQRRAPRSTPFTSLLSHRTSPTSLHRISGMWPRGG